MKNIVLVLLAGFSIFAGLRFANFIHFPYVENLSTMQQKSGEKLIMQGPCDERARFLSPERPSGMMISDFTFQDQTRRYLNVANPIDIRTEYGFMTKRAIDYIFRHDCEANGLKFTFAMKVDRDKNKMVFIAGPAYQGDRTDFDSTTNPESLNFESDIFCPDECGGDGDSTDTE